MMDKINGIPTRELGSTGERVTVLGVGGYHIGLNSIEQGIAIIRGAIDEGVNFMDNAWCYHQGKSEEIMGQALRDGYRDKVFLMTKNHGRDVPTFWKQLEQSLERLGTEQIDLLQFHEITAEGTPNAIFDSGVADAALEAREQGKIRYIGFTGHRWPHLHRQMLAHDYAWDASQMPVNALDWSFRSFTKGVLPTLVERGIGVLAMKSLAGTPGNILKSGISAAEAMGYVLSLPVSVVISGMDTLERLDQNLAIVRSWQPFDDDKMERIRQQVAPYAPNGKLEQMKVR